MIKKGFTLAEVIVTLGIIGVVAAITLPTLIQNTADRQIGPKLFNAVSVLENANVSLMGHEYDRLDSNPDISNGGNLDRDKYVKRLESVIKGSADGTVFTTKNGISYNILKEVGGNEYKDNNVVAPDSECFPSNEKIMNVEININADNSGNDVIASDMFYFSLMADGTLKPFGSDYGGWVGCAKSGRKWEDKCPNDQAPSDAIYCSGSIYANGGKVMYK